MDDYPAQIADLLENTASKVRSLTVDRMAGWAKWTALGLVLAMIGILAVIFLLVAIFRFLGELIGYEVTYAIFGGLFMVLGMFLWSKRKQPASKD